MYYIQNKQNVKKLQNLVGNVADVFVTSYQNTSHPVQVSIKSVSKCQNCEYEPQIRQSLRTLKCFLFENFVFNDLLMSSLLKLLLASKTEDI